MKTVRSWQPIATANKKMALDLFAEGSRYTDCRWNEIRNRWEYWGPNEFERMDRCAVPNPSHWMLIPFDPELDPE